MIVQLISLAGALAVLAGFVWLQTGRGQASDWSYLVANALGAGVLAGVALLEGQWGFLLLEGVWVLVSLHGLWRRARGGG